MRFFLRLCVRARDLFLWSTKSAKLSNVAFNVTHNMHILIFENDINELVKKIMLNFNYLEIFFIFKI